MRSAFGESFAVPDGYLNTPSFGVPPSVAVDAVRRELEAWRTGEFGSAALERFADQAREAFAKVLGVPASTVVTGSAVSQLISLVAASLPDGSRVLTVADEFTSTTFPFAAQEHRGITVTEVPHGELVSSVDGYDVVAVSVVQSADGRIIDLDALREATDLAGTRVLLDVSQAAGWFPLAVGWADWVVGACYKWLLCPKGQSYLVVRPGDLDELVPLGAGWFAAEDRLGSAYGLPLRLASDARRLDITPSHLPLAGTVASLNYIAGLDMAEVHRHCVGLAGALLDGLGLPAQGSAIVSLAGDEVAPRLADAGVTFAARNGRTRLGFHLYNTESDVELVLNALKGAEM